jgi:hypothetical protein
MVWAILAKIGKYLKDNRELLIAIPCYSAVGFLAFWCSLLTDDINNRIQSYSLAIDKDSTTYKVGNGKLTFTLYNNQGAASTLNIYGLSLTNNINQAKFFVSDLYDRGGNSIAKNKIVVNPTGVVLTPISETPAKVELTIQTSKELGNFHGWFMLLIGDEIISVPITASTDPLYKIALLWVIIGVLISIGTWEFANYFDRIRNAKQLVSLPVNNLNIALRNKLEVKKIKYDAHLASAVEAAKFSFVSLFAAVFGIATSYLALLSNPNVMELQTISQIDILSLIGIGLGIGGLAGFLNKP